MPTAAHRFLLTLVVLSTIACSASAFEPNEGGGGRSNAFYGQVAP